MAFEGSLTDISIVDVLQLLHLTQKTGELLVFGPRGRASILLRDGRIVGCMHPAAGMNVGRLLIDQGAVEPADIDEAVEAQQRAGTERKPLVVTLVALGRLERSAGWKALTKLVEDTVTEVVAWREGSFVFETGGVAAFDDFSHVPDGISEEVNLDTQSTLMEALRIHDERNRNELDGRGQEISLAADPGGAGGEPAETGKMRILVVDDEVLILRSLKRLFEAMGYITVLASDGAEAMRLAAAHPFDVALVDFKMPQPDGLHVLRHLRHTQPQCTRILMSGYLDLDSVLAAVNTCEVATVLTKPFTIDEAGAVIEKVRGRRARGDEEASGAVPASEPPGVGALRSCLEADLLRVALQPIVHAKSLDIFGFEALLRPEHPLFPGPLQLLAAAEAAGAIDDVADAVARKVGEWLRCFPDRFRIFLNIHPHELDNPTRLRARLADLAAWRHRVVLELTEGEQVTSRDCFAESLEVIREQGFALAIDDLGAGYNSLSVLAEIKADYVKIDRSLIRLVHQDDRRLQLVEMLITGSKRVGAVVVAEGIERDEEAKVLGDLGADLFQGYLFGRPSISPRVVLQGGRFRFHDGVREAAVVKARAKG